MKADRFYIRCEFARLLLKNGGSEQWKFTVKGSKITKPFTMHVLKRVFFTGHDGIHVILLPKLSISCHSTSLS